MSTATSRSQRCCRPENAAMYLFGQTIELHVDFDLTAAWRHHVSMLPSSWSQSAATTALRKVHSELFRVKLLREIPHWWILVRTAPPNHWFAFSVSRHVTRETNTIDCNATRDVQRPETGQQQLNSLTLALATPAQSTSLHGICDMLPRVFRP